MRQAPPALLRPPDQHQAPAVIATTNLDSAGVLAEAGWADGCAFRIECRVGAAGIALGGTVTVNVNPVSGQTPAQYFCACDWGTAVLSGSSANMTITITTTRAIAGRERLLVAVQWRVST
jgi:hypothetical protein